MKKINYYLQRLKNIFHLINAFLANIWYGFPSRKITVIGITGTDGKTTTTHLIAHILKSCGKKVSYISTIFAKIGKKEYDTGFHVTTPNPWLIQKLIKEAVNNKDEYFILETTSHALDQNRVWGINYKIGVLTNVTYEHLDYHLSYENYLKTKVKLLKRAEVAFFNKDDRSYLYVKKMLKGRKKIIEYQKLSIIKKNFPNLEKFNQENFSAAYLVALNLGLRSEEVLKAIKTFKLPKGRFDLVYDKDFKVIIDFAHTPNAFLKLLSEIRKKYLKNKGRLIHVFGSAGLRDNTKRPLMGEISGRFADFIILTEEDYRTEDPNKICQEVASGIKNKNYQVIIDRKKAIEKALKMAKKGDVVIFTGKAHEKSLCRGKTEYPWDEYRAVEIGLKK